MHHSRTQDFPATAVAVAASAAVLALVSCSPVPPSAPTASPPPPAAAPALQAHQAALPAVDPRRWLDGLAGSCWHESAFGSDSCFWRSSQQEVARLSRNHDQLLDCGALRLEGVSPDRIRASSWDGEHGEAALLLYVDGQDLWTYEDMNPRSDGARSTTRWRAIDVNHFEVFREWRDPQGKVLPAADSRPGPKPTPMPPAPPDLSSASLRFTRVPLDAGVAAMASQCQQWQRFTRRPGLSR